MKSVALIHTVESVAVSFAKKIRAALTVLTEEVKIHNIWDDFLSTDANAIGVFSTENKKRLLLDIQAAELTGADIIVTTCSTLTPHLEYIRPFVKTPIIAIDDAMAKKAVTFGSRILILATAQSTVEPTKIKLTKEASAAGLSNFEPDCIVCPDAFAALVKGDTQTHNRILLEKAHTFGTYDCIVLAQASMAHLTAQVAHICGSNVLNSPDLCVAQIKETIEKLISRRC